MLLDHQTSKARWHSLAAELARTRAGLSETLALLDQATSPEDSIPATENPATENPAAEKPGGMADLKARNARLAASNSALLSSAKAGAQTIAGLQSMVDSANVATIVLDTRLNIRIFTPAIAIMFQLRDADIGRPLAMFTPLAPDPRLLEDARTVLRTSKTIELDLKTSEDRWLRRTIKPSHDENTDVDGVVITYFDTTDARDATDQLTEERDSAEIRTNAKSAFLAAASHDLRQPLQAMAALQGLLAQSATDSGSVALLDRLDCTLEAITNLLDTLLDDDRVEHGAAQIHVHPITITSLFDALADAHGLTAEIDGTSLTFAPNHLSVCSDPLLLQQMLSNLIGNALRFAMHGKVLAGARQRGDTIVFEIWDNGIGIEPDQIEAIFKAYEQIVPTDAAGGQGLGLSIVASLGQLLDHKVDVRSVPGSGSVFTIEVPLADDVPAPPPAPESAPEPAAAAPTRLNAPDKTTSRQTVHIIDDDADVLQSLGALLSTRLPHVECHASAEDFLRDWNPDTAACLLVDAGLPGLDGLSLLRQLKAQGIMPPSIIITGRADYATAVAALRLGTLDFLEKPVAANALVASVDSALTMDATSRSTGAARAAARQNLSSLTQRERDVLEKVLDGHPSKNIAADLGISQRTVENHRASMMRKAGCRSLAALVRMVIAADPERPEPMTAMPAD